jgi:hypothetical protein
MKFGGLTAEQIGKLMETVDDALAAASGAIDTTRDISAGRKKGQIDKHRKQVMGLLTEVCAQVWDVTRLVRIGKRDGKPFRIT